MTHDRRSTAANQQSEHSGPSLLVGRVELARLLGVSTATLDRMRSAGRIGPTPIKLSPGRIAWRRSTIECWIAESERAGALLNMATWQAMIRSDASHGRSTAA
jgi:predicted DNA-binding transcriptional regulator AlpA